MGTHCVAKCKETLSATSLRHVTSTVPHSHLACTLATIRFAKGGCSWETKCMCGAGIIDEALLHKAPHAHLESYDDLLTLASNAEQALTYAGTNSTSCKASPRPLAPSPRTCILAPAQQSTDHLNVLHVRVPITQVTTRNVRRGREKGSQRTVSRWRGHLVSWPY